MKRALSLLLCCLLTIGLLAACGGNETTTTTTDGGEATSESDGTTATTEAVDFSEHEEFSIWLYATPNDYYSSYSDNPVIQYLNNKFNVTLNYEQPSSGTEADSLSLMFGTGEYTDMIEITSYTGSLRGLYDDGVIIDIAEYLKYMPNFQKLLDENNNFRKHAMNDEGKILKLPVTAAEPEVIWGSLVYRHDILETMTGGNVAFPSGNEVPTTIEDWDYMLPLFKQYFEAAGMANSAPLILPSNGYFFYGELGTGLGFQGGDFYLEDGTVKSSMLDDGLYTYLEKMNEWYEAGYIYQDFASRTSDPFYLPNTELTYGGAAGAWYGLASQLGEAMSMPEYGLEMDVRAAPSPLGEGVKPEDLLKRNPPPHEGSGVGSVVTTACDNIPKLLTIVDHMYSEDGGMLWKYGLNAEQVPESNNIYPDNGLIDGAYWFEDKVFVVNPQLDMVGGPVSLSDMQGQRLPGLSLNIYDRYVMTDINVQADEIWAQYDEFATKTKLPASLSYSNEDEKLMADAMVNVTDYSNAMIPQFIMGSEELTQESFDAFREQLIEYGLEDIVALRQSAYDRYQQR
jgi:ABC-type glycerol-3-phosphate transport system substrate-binding protein